MKRIGYVLAAIVIVVAATLLYFYEQREWTGRTVAVDPQAGVPGRVGIGEQHTQAVGRQVADQQQPTAQAPKSADEIKPSQAPNQPLAQQPDRLEKLASPEAQSLAQELAVMSTLKVGVVEFFMSQDRWPSSNAEIGVPMPEQYHGDKLRSARVLPDGVIELRFARGDSQTQGIVRLIADATNSASLGVRWRCESPNFPEIGSVVPDCSYTGQ